MRAAIVLSWALLALCGCEREQRRFVEAAPSNGLNANSIQVGGNQPAGLPPQSNIQSPYQNNAWAISEGKRLFAQMNCAGCHSLGGGGGMGPPLIDDKWIYGGEIENIHASIVEGRPNGMPAFRGKIPDQQVWELSAYVRSMSGQVSQDVANGRDDHMPPHPPDVMMPPQGDNRTQHEQQSPGETGGQRK